MTDIFVVPESLLQAVGSVPFEPHQVQVVKYGDHCRAMCELERRVDTAYHQRNNAAVALVRMALLLGWPAGRGLDDKTDNDLAWRHVVYLDLPNGEHVSYHMAPADVPLLDGLPEYAGKWDGKFTGTTAWADMVPEAQPMLYATCDGPEFDPAEVERLMRDVPVGETVQVAQLSCATWPKALLTLPFRTDLPVPEHASDWELPQNPNYWPKRFYSGPPSSLRLELPVPKAPFPPGVCACPKCEQPREAGKLFCAPHRSVDGRFLDSRPMTNERLAYMMQRDGEQQ